MKNYLYLITILILTMLSRVYSKGSSEQKDSTEQNYQIDKPGTITFTVGAKIKGKVDKPQVMIFLPKEKTFFKEVTLDRSFETELMEPLPFVPVPE